jgi:CBS domain-containing protein
MTTSVVTGGENNTIIEIADIMIQKGIERLPIVDKGGKLLGLITQSVLIRTMRKMFEK